MLPDSIELKLPRFREIHRPCSCFYRDYEYEDNAHLVMEMV